MKVWKIVIEEVQLVVKQVLPEDTASLYAEDVLVGTISNWDNGETLDADLVQPVGTLSAGQHAGVSYVKVGGKKPAVPF